jgi:hypothetical protein
MNNFYVYQYLRDVDDEYGLKGTPYYVGKGKGFRFIEKHRKDISVPADEFIYIYTDNLSEGDAHFLEIILIARYGRVDKKTGCLINKTNGGGGVSGWICSAEARAKMSASKMNHATSDETREKMSAWQRGRVLSTETREKMSSWQKGKVLSAEWKANISAAGKLRKPPSAEAREKMSAAAKVRCVIRKSLMLRG